MLEASTESYDRGFKWRCYQSLPGLRTVLFVAQDRIWVEVYRRRSGREWTYDSHSRLDEVLELSDPPCKLSVAEIYECVVDQIGGQGGV